MILRLLLSILISLTTGLLLTRVLWPVRLQVRSCRLIKFSIAVGLGLGLSAEIYFLWLWIAAGSRGGLMLADLILLAGLAGAHLLLDITARGRTAQQHPEYVSAGAIQARGLRWSLPAGFCVALVPALYAFLSSFYNRPHGEWDAWMAWNLRARFFFRAGDHWRDAFSGLFLGANPEYPVLLPSIIARSWRYAGLETELAPVLVAALFTFANIGLTYSSLCVLRSKGQGLMAGLLLAGTPFFIRHGTSQYADVPIAFFFLATLVLLCLHDNSVGQRSGLLVLTGMSAGLAAWTKNEGLLFVAALILATGATGLLKDGMRVYLERQLALAGGLLLVLPIALYAKVHFAPPDPMLDWQRSTLHKLVEWPRYWQILKAFGRESLRFGDWPLEVPPILAFYALLLGIDVQQRRRRGTIISMCILGLTLAGYAGAYLTTRYDLAWHLRTSLQRLLLQLWPSAVFLFFLLVRTPEQALGAE